MITAVLNISIQQATETKCLVKCNERNDEMKGLFSPESYHHLFSLQTVSIINTSSFSWFF